MINLRHLELQDKATFLAAMNEPWETNFVFAHYYESLANNSFETYINVLPLISIGQLIPSDHVPSTLLFAFDGSNRIVGRVSIRHQLNDLLLKVGGHVGYGVVPSRRRVGFANEILKESLIYIKSKLPHIERVLLTCDDSNLGSSKTIENNGGVFEDLVKDSSMEVAKRRYWIKLY
jgi:predicted acetyltransferase